MIKREDTPQRIARRNFEAKHKEERKAAHIVWGTSVSRAEAEEINTFLKEHRISKVELIKAGYEALQRKYGPHKWNRKKR